MVALLIIVILAALALQRYFVRRAKDAGNIKYVCRPSVRSCEPGEVFLVHSNVANTGKRPSAAIYIEERFPEQLNVLESEQFNVIVLKNGYRIYSSSVIIRPKQQIKRYLRASISERGEYRFSDADFKAGDFLGFHEFSHRMENDARIVVFPPKIEDAAFLSAFSNAADEIARRKQLLEDPISVCGYDPYTGREPLRMISWKQSAIRNELTVKKYDPVWNRSVQIVLDMQYHGEFDLNRRRQEICFSTARTVCEELEKRHIGYRLVTNAVISEDISVLSSEGGMGGSFRKILYSLGVAKHGAFCTLEETMRVACDAPGKQELIVFIATRPDDDVTESLNRARAFTGAKIVTLFASDLLPTPDDDKAKPSLKGGTKA
ncbi:MAG: DUF58 domain-containing protein [Clostridiales bacterium]|nr:DUF58 domain-containing protein [Clostridiales bacterium]